MARSPAAAVILYACLLNVCYGQSVSSQAACFPHVSSIPYPAYEWGAGLPIRVTVEFEVRSDGHFENIQVDDGGSDEIADTITDLLSKSLAGSDCSGKHVSVQLDFRIEGKPAKEPTSTVFFEDSEVIQIIVNPSEALCKSAPNSEYEARACYGRGTTLSKAKKYDEAISCLAQALQWVPDADTYIERGIAYRKSGHLAEAIADYTEAIRLAPSNTDAYFDRGNANRDAGAFDLAIEDYSQALSLKPGFVPAYGNRANIYLNQHRFDLALDDFSAILKNDPLNIDALNGRAVAYLSLGLVQQSIDDADCILYLQPGSPLALSNRAAAYQVQGRYDAATKDLQAALQTDPSYVSAYLGMAGIYANQQKLELAKQQLDKAIELQPGLALAYLERAQIRDALGDKAGAKSDREHVRSLPLPPSEFIVEKH
jgi:Tfp pilus assembly protein PilF